MAQIIEVADLNHPALACYAHLTNAQLRSRLEPEQGVLIAESPKVINTALDAGLSLFQRRQKWLESQKNSCPSFCYAETAQELGRLSEQRQYHSADTFVHERVHEL